MTSETVAPRERAAQLSHLARVIFYAAVIAFIAMQVWVNRLQIQINAELLQRIHAAERMR